MSEASNAGNRTMSDDIRKVLQVAVEAGRIGLPQSEKFARAIVEGDRYLTTDQFHFDSLAWMEFCISVELQSGLELTPADIAAMTHFYQIEEWLRARLWHDRLLRSG